MLTHRVLTFGFCLLSMSLSAQKFTISGHLTDSLSTESLIGATVHNPDNLQGTSTNQYGFYSLTLPAGDVRVVYSYVGYVPQTLSFNLERDTVINIRLTGAVMLDEVTVTADKTARTHESTQMSSVHIPIAQVKALPAFLGENDIMKALQLMPGIQSGGEGSSGLYVRGGGPDQNLILLDGVPVYNASHLFGFFSVFNSDAINNVELLKGGFPARYGGRVSSVIDISMKEGNSQRFHGEGSVGIVASRMTFEGPIIKDRTSFIVSGRRTYIDLLAKPFIRMANRESDAKYDVGYYFYDLTAKVNHKFSDKDRLYLSAYMGDDKFYVDEEDSYDTGIWLGPDGSSVSGHAVSETNAGIKWGNITAAARWNHIFTNKLFGNTTFTYSRYRMNIFMEDRYTSTDYMTDETSTDYYKVQYLSGIEDWSGRLAFDFLPSPAHYIRFGGNATYHTFNPGTLGVQAPDAPISLGSEKVYTWEYNAYAEDDIRLNHWLKVNAGLHWSAFSVHGRFYNAVQPRLSARALLTPEMSLKASYSRMAQYVHLLTNSNLGLPTDLWVPSTDVLKPQYSSQVALGLAHNFKNAYELSLEGYYKTMDNVLEYREGASTFDIDKQWENKVLQGSGRGYGIELFAQKKTGSFTGWIGYTLAWADRQFDDLNGGRRFSYKYDRRHDISIVAVKRFGKKIELSGTWVFGSGNCVTVPEVIYTASDPFSGDNRIEVLKYGDRNAFRMAPYHRLDLSISLIKQKSWGERRWIFAVYNVYNRKNPYYIDIDKQVRYEDNYDPSSSVWRPGGGTQTRYQYSQVSLFPIIPSISYQFKF